MQQRQLGFYDFSPSRGMRGPTPVRPSVPFGRGAQPPTHKSVRATIDQIHDDVSDVNVDNHWHVDVDDVGEAPSGVQSPAPGDAVGGPVPWQAEEPGEIPKPQTTPTCQVEADCED
jgi:hypothetical protein